MQYTMKRNVGGGQGNTSIKGKVSQQSNWQAGKDGGPESGGKGGEKASLLLATAHITLSTRNVFKMLY